MFVLLRTASRVPRRSKSLRGRSLLATLTLVAGCLTAVVTTSLVTSTPALADAVPPAPAGWTTVFGDDFAGPAGSPPSFANWFYDIGTGFGTGEKEHTTNSTDNVYLDGNGHLVLKAINNGGTWTSGRIESTRDDFQAPPGGKMEMIASIQQPNPANGLGYWPAFWALGAPMRTGGGWPQSGEIDMMEDVNGLNEASQTLHDSANSPGHALIPCPGAGSTCQTGYHTYAVIIDRTNTSAETLQFLMDGVVESTITEASVGVAAWQQAIDHGFFIIWDLAMGGNYPDGISGQTTPTAATTSGAFMSAAWVAVYEQGGDSTPAGRATATGTVKGLGGLCLTNQNSLNVASNPIGVSACNGSLGQQWSSYDDGTVRVEGGCLDVVAAGKTSGTNVDWYPCNASNAQNWTRQANGTLLNPNSGLCLTVPGGNTGARLDIETCTGSAQQLWTVPTGGGGGNTVTVTNPGNQSGTVGTAVSLQLHASDSATGQTLTYSATGLPAGLSISASSGLISGTPTAAGTSNVTVSASDATGAAGSASFTWTVTGGSGGSCGTTNIALNRPATSSSTENAGTSPGNAVDGNPNTRWSSAFSDPQWLQVDLGSVQSICQVVLNWEAAYAKAFQLQTSTDGTTWISIYSTTTGTGGTQTINVSGSGRYLRMNGTARATQYGYSLWELSAFAGTSGNTVTVTNPGNQTATVGTATSLQILATDSASGQTLTYSATGLPAGLSISATSGLISGTPSAAGSTATTVTARDATGAAGATSFTWTVNPASGCGTTNIALNKPATASSQENAAFPPANAVDGNAGTRWSSAFSDPQWLQVDLGATRSICKVGLSWEPAYAKAFQVQTSNDGTTWTTIYSTTTGTGGTQTVTVTGSGRYVRVLGTARATQYGYSLWEFQVFGS